MSCKQCLQILYPLSCILFSHPNLVLDKYRARVTLYSSMKMQRKQTEWKQGCCQSSTGIVNVKSRSPTLSVSVKKISQHRCLPSFLSCPPCLVLGKQMTQSPLIDHHFLTPLLSCLPFLPLLAVFLSLCLSHSFSLNILTQNNDLRGHKRSTRPETEYGLRPGTLLPCPVRNKKDIPSLKESLFHVMSWSFLSCPPIQSKKTF